MKKLIMILLAALPLVAVAQTKLTPEQELEKAQKELEAAQRKLTEARERAQKAQQIQGEAPRKEENAGWTVPQNQTPVAKKQDPAEKRKEAKPSKAEDLAPYLAADAVPLVDGRVEWSCVVAMPGVSAEVLYAKCKGYLNDVVQGGKSQKKSRIALVNDREHRLIASMREAMSIPSAYLSLNHPTFCYALETVCVDGKATLTMSRLVYSYDASSKQESKKAEEWITDKEAINENRTRLQPLTGKVRCTTIDRKNELFAAFERAMKE